MLTVLHNVLDLTYPAIDKMWLEEIHVNPKLSRVVIVLKDGRAFNVPVKPGQINLALEMMRECRERINALRMMPAGSKHPRPYTP